MATTTTQRIFNFSAGPAVLPVEVLEEAQRDLLSLPGVGMSILEISHRSKTFDDVLQGCEADMRKLAGIPANYKILFLQGGASLQFSMVPMNLLPATGSADYIVTGVWGQKAVKEAKKCGGVKIAGSTEAEQFTRVPKQAELTLDPGAAYVHMTSNNTIYGTEWKWLPETGNVPLVSDMSSDIFSGPVDVDEARAHLRRRAEEPRAGRRHLVIIREDVLERSPASLHTMLSYKMHADNQSLYNTPPVFAIYVMRLVMTWLLENGGLAAVDRVNQRKADALYAEIDRTGFYKGHAAKDSRSRMNVTFRLASEELEKKFAKDATSAGLDGLKGHRSVGGMRASIYNAFPEAGVTALVQFMQEFEKKNG